MQWHQTRRSNGTNRFTDQCLPISWIKHTVAACVIISAVVKRRQRCNSRWIYRIKSSILVEARDFVATEFNRSTRSSISIFFFILEHLVCNSVYWPFPTISVGKDVFVLFSLSNLILFTCLISTLGYFFENSLFASGISNFFILFRSLFNVHELSAIEYGYKIIFISICQLFWRDSYSRKKIVHCLIQFAFPGRNFLVIFHCCSRSRVSVHSFVSRTFSILMCIFTELCVVNRIEESK